MNLEPRAVSQGWHGAPALDYSAFLGTLYTFQSHCDGTGALAVSQDTASYLKSGDICHLNKMRHIVPRFIVFVTSYDLIPQIQ